MGPMGFPETSIIYDQYTLRNVLEERGCQFCFNPYLYLRIGYSEKLCLLCVLIKMLAVFVDGSAVQSWNA